MGAFFALGPCYCCKRLISFNPHRVPSIPANLTTTGEKEPVCRDCIMRANPDRKKNGLPLIEILDGAYEPEDLDDQDQGGVAY